MKCQHCGFMTRDIDVRHYTSMKCGRCNLCPVKTVLREKFRSETDNDFDGDIQLPQAEEQLCPKEEKEVIPESKTQSKETADAQRTSTSLSYQLQVDNEVHRLQDFTGMLRKVIITCALHLTSEKLAETLDVSVDLASAWKLIAHRLRELQVVYHASNLRESNFDIAIAARDLDDPRIMTDQWREIR